MAVTAGSGSAAATGTDPSGRERPVRDPGPGPVSHVHLDMNEALPLRTARST